MPARRMRKVGFAVFFVVALVGAVLLIVSQVPLRREYYEVVGTRSFSPGEPLTFYWTFDPNVKYRFEVKGAYWTSQSYYLTHYFNVGNWTYVYGEEARAPLVENPWSWNLSGGGAAATHTLSVTFWHYDGNAGQVIDQATTPTFVEISEFRESTYYLTYLIYVGLPLLIIGAILITVIALTDSLKSQTSVSKRLIRGVL